MKRKFKTLFAILVSVIFTFQLISNTVEAKGNVGSNRAPVIQNVKPASITTNEDQPSTLSLSAKDTNGDTLSWNVSTGPTNGTTTISTVSSSRGNSTIKVTYKPNSNYYGQDSFIVMVSDGKGGTDNIKVNVTINSVNASPLNIAVPSIGGITTVGSILTANPGTWTDDSQVSLLFSYQWQEATDIQGTGQVDVATGSSYILTDKDTGKYIRVKVTATDDGGLSSTANSAWLVIPGKTINYVSFGDSIATGTIYPGKLITSYVTNFYEYLKTQNPTAQVNLQKFATDGYRTNELYSKLGLGLDPMDIAYESAIKNASIITISIGGNNLMQAAKDSSSYSGYNFNYINDSVAQLGIKDFNDQWAPIINKIKALNSNAKIIVATVYNPFNAADTALHNQVDSYLFRTDGTGINNIINNNTTLGYRTADVFTAFDVYSNGNMGKITYFYPNAWDILGVLTRNPHPNSAGQNIITNLHIQAYSSFIN